MNKLGVTDIDVAVIVLASGSGTRLGEPVPKAAVKVGGKTLLHHALQGVHDSGVADMTVVTLPPNCSEICPQLYDDANRFGAMVSTGGDTRTASVVAAMRTVRAVCSLQQILPPRVVLIHDCARPFTPPRVYQRVLDELNTGSDAVIPVLPVVDTIKTVDAYGYVTGTPPRSQMRAVQTPQGFEWRVLEAAHRRSRRLPPEESEKITDDAMAVEAAGRRVMTVRGHMDAFKITTPMDLRIARALYAAPDSSAA